MWGEGEVLSLFKEGDKLWKNPKEAYEPYFRSTDFGRLWGVDHFGKQQAWLLVWQVHSGSEEFRDGHVLSLDVFSLST